MKGHAYVYGVHGEDGVSHVSIGSVAVPLGGVDRLLLLVTGIGR
jgi:hypothetical protein